MQNQVSLNAVTRSSASHVHWERDSRQSAPEISLSTLKYEGLGTWKGDHPRDNIIKSPVNENSFFQKKVYVGGGGHLRKPATHPPLFPFCQHRKAIISLMCSHRSLKDS